MAVAKIREGGHSLSAFIADIRAARISAKLGDLTPEELAKVKQAWEEAETIAKSGTNLSFRQRLEQAVVEAMMDRPGYEYAETWELVDLSKPHRIANPGPNLGPGQVRYQATFADPINGEHVNISVNYDPDTGLFGIIKEAGGK